jgi:hypothetical protein
MLFTGTVAKVASLIAIVIGGYGLRMASLAQRKLSISSNSILARIAVFIGGLDTKNPCSSGKLNFVVALADLVSQKARNSVQTSDKAEESENSENFETSHSM